MQALAGAKAWHVHLSRPLLRAETGAAGAYLQARALICYQGSPKRLDGWHCSKACTATLHEAVLPILVVPACLLAVQHTSPVTCDSLMALFGAKARCIPVRVVFISKVSCIPFHINLMSILLMLHMGLLLLLAT